MFSGVSGRVIREILENSVAELGDGDAAVDPSGQFMQVSSTLKFQYVMEGGKNDARAITRRGAVHAGWRFLHAHLVANNVRFSLQLLTLLFLFPCSCGIPR